jgi:hypothetical protein
MDKYNKYKAEKKAQVEKLVKDFEDTVNSMTFGEDEYQIFFEAFCRCHRTLQASMFNVILSLISKMTSEDYFTDGRNEHSKTVAQKLVEGFAEQYKNDYLDSEPNRRGDEYYEKKAEEYKQMILDEPAKFLGMPFI